MRRPLQLLALVAAVVLLAGCLPVSINPLYTGKDDMIMENDLLGQWQPAKKSESWGTWTFTQMEDSNQYMVKQQGKDVPTAYLVGTLVKLGDRAFLDLYPRKIEPAPKVNNWYAIHFLPPKHTFMRLELKDNQLDLKVLSPEALRDLLKEKPDLIAHRLVKMEVPVTQDDMRAGRVREMEVPLLLAESKDLQTFVKKHLDDEHFFKEGKLPPRQGVRLIKQRCDQKA